MNSVDKILHQYPNLPHKLLVAFSLYCANDIKHLITDPRSLKALEITELWLKGKASREALRVALYDAVNAVHAARGASYVYTAYSVVNTAYAAISGNYTAAIDAANAATDRGKKLKEYADKLLEMINELSETEKELARL